MRPMPALLSILLVLLLSTPAPGATWIVPDSLPTITAALLLAAGGDSVLVAPGTYPEFLVMVDGVALLASDPQGRPVVDGTGTGVVLTAIGCGASTRVSGFEIRNGAGTGLGGGVYLNASSLELTNCRFEGNSAVHGGGLGAVGASFILSDCEFAGNSATQSGGAISLTDFSTPAISGCLLTGNTALAGGGIAVRNGCTPSIDGSVLDSNQADLGAAVWYDFFSGGSLRNCTVVSNLATTASGGGIFFNVLATPSVTENILAFGTGGGAVLIAPGGNPVFGCNDVFGNAGGDSLAGGTDLGTNFSADPLFCDAPASDYTLQDLSPCLPDSTCALVGAFGPGGCPSVPVREPFAWTTWGALKARYR